MVSARRVIELHDRLRADARIDALVTASAGVAIHVGGESTEQLLARADAALYAAKDAGRDCVRVAISPVVRAIL